MPYPAPLYARPDNKRENRGPFARWTCRITTTYTMSNKTKYACAGYINGRVCKNDTPRKITQLEAEVSQIIAAVGQGLLSPALRRQLHETESKIERLRSAPKPASIEALLPELPGRTREHIVRSAQVGGAGTGSGKDGSEAGPRYGPHNDSARRSGPRRDR